MTANDASPTRHDSTSSRRRLASYTGIVLVVVLLGLWASWTALSEKPEVASQVLRSQVHADRAVTVHVEIAKTRDVPATCKLVALGMDGGSVGSARVTVAADVERTRVSHRVPITAPVASTQVASCQLASSG